MRTMTVSSRLRRTHRIWAAVVRVSVNLSIRWCGNRRGFGRGDRERLDVVTG